MRKTLIALLIAALATGGCRNEQPTNSSKKPDTNTTVTAAEFESNDALNYFVDTVGNQDGVSGRLEGDYLRLKLNEGDRFYIITAPDFKSFNPPYSKYHSIGRIYTSIDELKADDRSTKDRGVLVMPDKEVGILEFNRDGKITNAWRTKGYISRVQWVQVPIPNIDYEGEMLNRLLEAHLSHNNISLKK